MCFGGGPSPPKPLPVEQELDKSGQQANDMLKKRLRALSGFSSTSLTGGQGLVATANIGKTSLGA